MNKKLTCPDASKKYCKSLVIKDISEHDKEDVMNILQTSFPDVYPNEKDFWSDIIDINPGLTLNMNGETVGMSVVRYPQLINGKAVSWIDLFAIKPEYRRMGLGEKLLKESEVIIKNSGAKKGKLWTGVDMTPAVSFYSKHDWKVSDFIEWGYRNGHRLTMEKII